MRYSSLPPLRRANGFGLIEMLVAVVVFSLGLLGLAGLQATGLKNNYSAYVRAQAAQYAYDMTDRMRANRTAARAGSYDLELADSAPACDSLPECDQAEWLAELATLPEGDGSIAVNNDVITLRIQWNDSRAGGGDAADITFQSQL